MKLIFDIGLNNGDDSAYYLALGYRVVGVEANPLLAEQCAKRFEIEIREGRMKIANVGVLKEPGEFTFYLNLTESGWSSFEPERGQKGGKWEELPIRCMTTIELFKQYGAPFFMKVDIEGSDIQTLYSLTPATAPPYVSLELNDADPTIEKLIELGYSSFKLVNGATHWPSMPIFEHQTGWRILRKIGRLAPFVKKGIGMLPPRLRPNSEYDPPTIYNPDNYPFEHGSSGPFGEKAAGVWLNSKGILVRWESLKRHYSRDGAGQEIWWDVHARHGKRGAG